ncbi:MAG: TlpA disulfide reductase family protein [Ferruginibacter sp.]
MRQIIFFIFFMPAIKAVCQNQPTGGKVNQTHYVKLMGAIYNVENSTQIREEKNTIIFDLIETSIKLDPKAEINLSIIAQAINLNLVQTDSLVKLTDTSLLHSPFMSNVRYSRNRIAVSETGKFFPPLTLTDSNGKKVLISDYKGKFLLIDAWSSWCTPCRGQVPELLKIYKKYYNKGFEILGVSMDQNKEAWLKAVEKDKQPWPQFCELVSFQQNSFARKFFITGIPSNFLIDENGILIGQDLSPEQVAFLLKKSF